ncbi:MAG: class II aldolase/adducin family protein, partial [Burkholderiaceae bacterium]
MKANDFIQDIRKGYPELQPDTDYPPLQWRSVRGEVSDVEWQARVDCACAYRLVKHFAMDDLIYNHISVRIPGSDSFLLNAFGLLYEEITASSLIKVSLAGDVLWAPDFPKGLAYQFNPAGWVIHAAIHEARPELEGVIH